MRRRPVRGKTCPNIECSLHGQNGHGKIIRHGSFKTRHGGRLRFRCSPCGTTFSSSTSTAYHRIQHSKVTFDTVDRWLERAAAFAMAFNARMIHGFELIELQAVELRAFKPRRSGPIWVFADIETWSRPWPSTVVGTRP